MIPRARTVSPIFAAALWLLFTGAPGAERVSKGTIVLAKREGKWMPAQVMAMDHRFAEVIFLSRGRSERIFMADSMRPLDWKASSHVICIPARGKRALPAVITRRWPRSVFVVFYNGRRRMRALRFCRDGRLAHEFKPAPKAFRLKIPAKTSPREMPASRRIIADFSMGPTNLKPREARGLQWAIFRRVQGYLAQGYPVALPRFGRGAGDRSATPRILIGYDDTARKVRLADERLGETFLDYDVFLRNWKRGDGRGAYAYRVLAKHARNR